MTNHPKFVSRDLIDIYFWFWSGQGCEENYFFLSQPFSLLNLACIITPNKSLDTQDQIGLQIYRQSPIFLPLAKSLF